MNCVHCTSSGSLFLNQAGLGRTISGRCNMLVKNVQTSIIYEIIMCILCTIDDCTIYLYSDVLIQIIMCMHIWGHPRVTYHFLSGNLTPSVSVTGDPAGSMPADTHLFQECTPPCLLQSPPLSSAGVWHPVHCCMCGCFSCEYNIML